MMASWREGTKVQYDTYIRKWVDYCKQAKCDLVSPPVSVAFDFLTSLFDTGLSYSSINTASSALSSVLVIENSKMPFGQLPLVRRFMKGIFELRPSLPRYPTVWNVSTVFNYVRTQPDIADLSLKELSVRLVFLLLLLSGQRCQTVHYFTIDNMELSDTKCVFKVIDKVKQTRKGYHIPPITYERYAHEVKLCPVVHIQEYIKRTASLRKPMCKQLLVSLSVPMDPFLRQLLHVGASRFWRQQALTLPNFIVIARGQHQLLMWLMPMLTYPAFWKLLVGQTNKHSKNFIINLVQRLVLIWAQRCLTLTFINGNTLSYVCKYY